MQGRVKWFDDEKGYGFIDANVDKDIFVHYSSIRTDGHKTLKENDKVIFDVVETDKGYHAKNVLIEEKVNS